MTTTDIVNKLKHEALAEARVKTYSKDDVLCFGWVPETRTYRLMHQHRGLIMTVLDASKADGESLLDQAFTLLEAKGMRLLIVADNKSAKY